MSAEKETMEGDDSLTWAEDQDDQERLWEKIESKRHVLTKTINPSKLTAYLRQCKVIDEEDEDEILCSHLLTSRRARASRLLDILRSRGKRGYEAFLESLELYYAELYKLITGKEPTRCCSVLVVEEGYEGLTQFLMSEAVKVQKQLKDKAVEIHKLHSKCEMLQETNKRLSRDHLELRSLQERYSKLKEEFNLHSNDLNKVKEENYLLALRYAQLNEEKSMAVSRSRELQLEGIEEECLMARSLSNKLKKDMENMPSRQSIIQLQHDNDQLQTTVYELQRFVQVRNNLPSTEKALLDIMDQDRKEALEDRQELVQRFHDTAMELQQAEELRDKYLKEKEGLGLQSAMILKECQMHKQRIASILQQLEEVEKERDKALKARDEAQSAYAQSMLDNGRYRRQIWAMEEKLDNLQMELTRKEAKIGSLQSQLHQLRGGTGAMDYLDSCDLLSSRLNIIDCPEDWSSTDHDQETFPKFRRRHCIKRLDSSMMQSRELPVSEYGEDLSPVELLWSDIEHEREVNRFSMMAFPPCKESLTRRLKQEEPASRFESWPLSSSTENEDSSPGHLHSLSVSPSLFGARFHPLSEDPSCVAVSDQDNRNDKRTHTLSLSMPDLTNTINSIKHGCDDAFTPEPNESATFTQESSELDKLEDETRHRISRRNCTRKGMQWNVRKSCAADPLGNQQNEEGCRRMEQVLEEDGSFYIRVNLNILGHVDNCSLQVKCDEILHILDTGQHTKYEWLCARVDPFTKKDLERGTIPSYSRAYQLLLLKIYALTANVREKEREKKFMKNNVKVKKVCSDRVRIVPASLPQYLPSASNPSLRSWHENKDEKILPYSLVQPITVHQKRPVIIMPTELAKALMDCLLQAPPASDFSMVQPEIVTEEQLKTKTRFSLQKIRNQANFECITLETIKDVIAKHKHGLLPIGVHSAKDLVAEKIYTIIIHIKVTTKNIKKLRKLAPKSCSSDNEFLKLYRIEQKHLESVPCLSATVEPNTWTNVEELIKVVKTSVFQEQQKIVWIDENKLLPDLENLSPAEPTSQPYVSSCL
ncbi:caspase recruitment domain-containing protein 11-like isoform X2 [Stegostoma tigrinum]|uniref:caspase recruitment domain-containing protein 11-like isoform X2 n=1 Tax=Stegostoma tigrinum TaxID=3053191 RepID=UPI002870092D|nr:caspase recruitment domain-containing protein 11-like isoform X2 [Stegostoma tigrinum]